MTNIGDHAAQLSEARNGVYVAMFDMVAIHGECGQHNPAGDAAAEALDRTGVVRKLMACLVEALPGLVDHTEKVYADLTTAVGKFDGLGQQPDVMERLDLAQRNLGGDAPGGVSRLELLGGLAAKAGAVMENLRTAEQSFAEISEALEPYGPSVQAVRDPAAEAIEMIDSRAEAAGIPLNAITILF